MNAGRSDASTSTDDVKDLPLCLFYFTHPFGVLSPEPPTVTAAPHRIARTFLNMEPVSPFTFWSSPTDESYITTSGEARPDYELGDSTVHREPVRVLSVTRARKCTLEMGARDTLSSSLFSSEMWFNSGSSCRSTEYPRRLVPYNRILPPLRLPSPRDTCDEYSSEDLWPKKCLNPEKFFLPPIEMPAVEVKVSTSGKSSIEGGRTSSAASSQASLGLREWRGAARRPLGVRKPRRGARLADVRRVLATLTRRTLKARSWSAMGYMLEKCPTVYVCCGSVPLRAAVFAIGALGLAWAALYFFAFSERGAGLLPGAGVSGGAASALQCVHGALGVLLCALHVLLLLAAACEADALCDVYVWGMPVLWAALLLAALAAALPAALAGHLVHSCLFLLLVFATVLVSFYFVVVVANYRMTLP